MSARPVDGQPRWTRRCRPRFVAWLTTEEAGWITGQVIHSEGGFARWRPRSG